MIEDLGKQIEELKAELATNEADLVEEAEDIAKRLREMADRFEKVAKDGAEYVDFLFDDTLFAGSHVDFERNRVHLSSYMIQKRLKERSATLEYLNDLYDSEYHQQLEEEERAAAAIHAGLKGED